MLAAVGEAVNPAQVVPARRSKPKGAAEAVNLTAQVALVRKKPSRKNPGKAAEAANQTAQVALIWKKPKSPKKSPGKAVEADTACAVRTAQLNEKGPMVFEPSAFLSSE